MNKDIEYKERRDKVSIDEKVMIKRESSIVGSYIDKLREREDDGGKCQFILTLDITTVKWES